MCFDDVALGLDEEGLFPLGLLVDELPYVLEPSLCRGGYRSHQVS